MTRTELLEQWKQSGPMIAPSMLKCDFGNLDRDIQKLEAGNAPLLHLDVMDGHFVPNLSYGPMVIERMRELTSMPFDAHLMISDPEKYLQDYLKAGCDAITIHYEAVPEPTALLEKIREADCVSGLAINPGTPVEAIEPFIGSCDLVLVMSVNPGFGGQKFIPEAVPKLQHLSDKYGDQLILSVDGGIGSSTIEQVSAAGTSLFVCGSSVFDQPDYAIAIADLASKAESAANTAAS